MKSLCLNKKFVFAALLFLIVFSGCLSESQTLSEPPETTLQTTLSPSTTTMRQIQTAQMVFEETCSVCHSIDRPKSKKKSRAEWQETVKRMQNVNGARQKADLTDEKARIIINHLSANYGK